MVISIILASVVCIVVSCKVLATVADWREDREEERVWEAYRAAQRSRYRYEE